MYLYVLNYTVPMCIVVINYCTCTWNLSNNDTYEIRTLSGVSIVAIVYETISEIRTPL